MKNLKTIIVILFLLIFIKQTSCFGQNFYFKPTIGGGYGVDGSPYIINTYTNTDTTIYVLKSNVKFLSIGNGLNTGFAVGRNFGKTFSFEINFIYSKRLPIKIHNTNNYQLSGLNLTEAWEYKFIGHSFCIAPSFIISLGFEKLNPYCKIGFNFQKGTLKEVDSIYVSGPAFFPRGYTQRWTHYADIYYGLKTALGFEFPFSKKTKIFFEIAYDNIAFKPSKSTMTEYSTNGTSLMGQINTMEREIIYVDEIYPESSPVLNKPFPLLKEKLSFNSLTINLGFKF